MNYREDISYSVIRGSSLFYDRYREWGVFQNLSDAVNLYIEIAFRNVFDDVFIVERRWSYELNCYYGVRL